MIRIMLIASIAAIAQMAGAANSLPVSNAWNVAPSGNATSSGELHFRMTAGEANPVDITVPIMSGAKEGSIARYIQRALSSQLRAHQVEVEAGEGANVLVTSSANANFSLELVTSDVESVRVAVQSAAPTAPPTVPKQATPANPPPPATPPAPGDAMPTSERGSTRERLTAGGCASCEFHADAESLATAERQRRRGCAGQRAAARRHARRNSAERAAAQRHARNSAERTAADALIAFAAVRA